MYQIKKVMLLDVIKENPCELLKKVMNYYKNYYLLTVPIPDHG